jgi:putative PIN family toxin of toxin-antitoxin system
MVFLQALARPGGPAGACFDLVDSGNVSLYVSADVLSEVGGVLMRPALSRKFERLTPERVARFLDFAERHSTVVVNVPRLIELERDPKDEKYLNLAIAAGADRLVTRDRDLLDLMTPGDPIGTKVRSVAPQLRIVDVPFFVHELSTPDGSSRHGNA